jgi:hypothetical protein
MQVLDCAEGVVDQRNCKKEKSDYSPDVVCFKKISGLGRLSDNENKQGSAN